MSVDAHTVSLLYRYLRMLSVRVGRGTVARLLAHPLGNSMRGLSDALDELGIRNAVYQLPPEYFDQLEAPFIAVTRQAEAPFCLVERINGTSLAVYTRGRRIRVEREAFLRTWTGGVLVGEVTAETQQDSYFFIRNVAYWICRYSLLGAGILGTYWLSERRRLWQELCIYLRCVQACSFLLLSCTKRCPTGISCIGFVTLARQSIAMRCCSPKVPAWRVWAWASLVCSISVRCCCLRSAILMALGGLLQAVLRQRWLLRFILLFTNCL